MKGTLSQPETASLRIAAHHSSASAAKVVRTCSKPWKSLDCEYSRTMSRFSSLMRRTHDILGAPRGLHHKLGLAAGAQCNSLQAAPGGLIGDAALVLSLCRCGRRTQ